MSDSPVASVIIPLYNKAPHIARTIRSVLCQTEQNFEIIIVDGQSTDEGPTIVRLFEDERIVLLEQRGKGVSSARNEGVSHSESDFIAFLDADDEWGPNHLQILLRLREKYPNAGAYTTAYSIISPKSKPRMAVYYGIPGRPWEGLIPSYFKSAAWGSSPIWTSAVGIPKQIVEEMGGFATGVCWGEDIALWGRIALKYPIAFSWDGMGIYHIDATNRLSERYDPVIEHIFITYARNAFRAGEVPLVLRDDLMEYLASMQIYTAWHNLTAKRPDLARNNLKGCNVRSLWRSKCWALFWAHIPPTMFIAAKRYKQLLTQINYNIECNLKKSSSKP